MKFFPYKRKHLGKTELQFIIAVMIDSACSQIYSDSDAVKEGFIKDGSENLRVILEVLGWNLSILYAQTIGMNEGMGVADALEIVELGDRVERYGQKYFEPGTRQKIERLVEDWYREVFGKKPA